MEKSKASGPQKVLDGVISLNRYIEEVEDTLYTQVKSGKPDTEICSDAALQILAAAQIRVIAVSATYKMLSTLEIADNEELEMANTHAWKMLESIQQAYQIIADIYMKAEELDCLEVDFSEKAMSPILERLSEEHFPDIMADYKPGKG